MTLKGKWKCNAFGWFIFPIGWFYLMMIIWSANPRPQPDNEQCKYKQAFYVLVWIVWFLVRFLELWFPQLFIWFAVHMCIFHLRWFCQLRFAKIYLSYAVCVWFEYNAVSVCISSLPILRYTNLFHFILYFCSIYNIPPDAGPITVRTRGCVWSQSRRIRGITSSLWLPGADQSEAFTTRH